jgi:acetyltransferase
MNNKKIEKLFNPKNIAVIGATDRESSVGESLMNNLISNDFQGDIYPVNPRRDKVKDIKAYSNVGEIPEKIDLAIIVTPAKTIPFIMEECGQIGVENVLIISSGFEEVGAEGAKMNSQVLNSARKYGIRIRIS